MLLAPENKDGVPGREETVVLCCTEAPFTLATDTIFHKSLSLN